MIFMLALELPHNDIIAVEYLGLAKVSATQELQKDVLRHVLSELLPASREIIDVGDAPQKDFLNGVFVKCIQCDVKANLGQFTVDLREDERFRTLQNLNRSQFKVQISSPGQSLTTWTIEVGTRKLAWYPLLKTDALPSGSALTSANFVIQSCVEGVNCPNTAVYATRKECLQKIDQLQSKRIDASLLTGSVAKTTLLHIEKIPFLNDVKANTLIRASLVTPGSSLSIKTSAKALKNGSVGDVIPVEIQSLSGKPSRNKFLNGRVKGEGEVEIVR